jgi:hypothetical protein
MKGLVTTLAFGAAVGATALIVAIQRDPFTFTNRAGETPTDAEFVRRVPVTVLAPLVEQSNVITLQEVDIRARPSSLAAPAPRPAPEPELLLPEVVPAPCTDGEYRKLEENRGVYLMCPGNETSPLED